MLSITRTIIIIVFTISTFLIYEMNCLWFPFVSDSDQTPLTYMTEMQDLFETKITNLNIYSFAYLKKVINKNCSDYKRNNLDETQQHYYYEFRPKIQKIHVIILTPFKNYTYPLSSPAKIWNYADDIIDYDEKSTVILITGWQFKEMTASAIIDNFYQAYFCRGNYNVMVIDTGNLVKNLDTWSRFDVNYVGSKVETFLELGVNMHGIKPSNIHLIGHGLGASIAAIAGRLFTKRTNHKLSRITALDPTYPCHIHEHDYDDSYSSDEHDDNSDNSSNNKNYLTSILKRGDAEFTDVIHSTTGLFANAKFIIHGDVDFYPGGILLAPNGCITISCAHLRAIEYYTETVIPGNEENFIAYKCESLEQLKIYSRCEKDDDDNKRNNFTMGFSVDKSIHGIFTTKVNSRKPFGLNAKKYQNIITKNLQCSKEFKKFHNTYN